MHFVTANTGAGHARRCGPPKLTSEGLGGRGRQGEANEGHTRALAVAERRCDGDEDQCLVELGVSTEESERELGNEGKGCGLIWGWSSPFIGAGGALGRRLPGGLRRRFKGGESRWGS
jgi:hypothetical protein